MRFIFLIFPFFLLVVSCCKEDIPPTQTDEYGVIISQPIQWKYHLHASGQYHSNSYFDSPIVYNSNIAIPTTETDGSKCMTMISSRTGKSLWHWSDVFQQSYGADLNIDWLVCRNGLMTWQVASRSYCVDLKDGSTFWKYQRDRYYDIRLNPFNDNFFAYSFATRSDGHDEQVAFLGNLETGDLFEFLRANYSCEYVAPITDNGSVGAIIYINQLPVSSNLLLVTYAEPLPEWKVRSMFGLYNTETQEWIYERKILADPLWNTSVFHTPIIYNGRVYANVGNNIVCHDVKTGEQIWAQEFEQDFLFSGFIIEDGMLLANCEDTYLYRINPELGNIEWRIKSAGTCSRMSYLNGVVYYVGGSTGYLHAVDTESGLKTVWRIDASKLGESGGSFTTNAVYCIPGENGEKGRVIALSGRYAYCFEAYR